jgi:hypothetical protein
MEEIEEKIMVKTLESMNEKIRIGHTVKYRGKEVQELNVIRIRQGFRVFKRVYVKYSDGTVNVLSFSDFLSRRIETE